MWALLADARLMAAIFSTILFFAAIIALPDPIALASGLLFVLFMWFFWVYRRVTEEGGVRRIWLRNPLNYSSSTVGTERQSSQAPPWSITSRRPANEDYRELP
jgi:hypothetical protein